jgi:uncharacterized protein (TIGR00255 family)
MTGYGRFETGLFKIESRSVNHRYIDIFIKTPASLYYLEPAIRRIVKNELNRGKIEIIITVSKDARGLITINRPLALEFYSALKSLSDELSLCNEIGVEVFTTFKEIFIKEEPAFEDEELLRGVKKSIEALKQMRIEEGAILASDIYERITLLSKYTEQLTALSVNHFVSLKEKFTKRIAELAGETMLDENRLFQEIAIMAERSDITEEIVRIKSHIQQLKNTLNDSDVSGRKMDFICQELNREINTVGSKSTDSEISAIVIELKSESEKLREQVQNIQ